MLELARGGLDEVAVASDHGKWGLSQGVEWNVDDDSVQNRPQHILLFFQR